MSKDDSSFDDVVKMNGGMIFSVSCSRKYFTCPRPKVQVLRLFSKVTGTDKPLDQNRHYLKVSIKILDSPDLVSFMSNSVSVGIF